MTFFSIVSFIIEIYNYFSLEISNWFLICIYQTFHPELKPMEIGEEHSSDKDSGTFLCKIIWKAKKVFLN